MAYSFHENIYTVQLFCLMFFAMFRLVVIQVLLSVVFRNCDGIICPDNWLTAGSSCYLYVTSDDHPHSWENAITHCYNDKAQLITIHTDDAVKVVMEILTGPDAPAALHIGLKRIEDKREAGREANMFGYVWLDGRPLQSNSALSNLTIDNSLINTTVTQEGQSSVAHARLDNSSGSLKVLLAADRSADENLNLICERNEVFRCVKLMQPLTPHLRDVRMNAALCSAYCALNDPGDVDLAVWDHTGCECMARLPFNTAPSKLCERCQGETWMECGQETNNKIAMSSNFKTAVPVSPESCENLYTSGIVTGMHIDMSACGVFVAEALASQLVCENPDCFAIENYCVCVHDLPAFSPYEAQFEICGQTYHSDLYTFSMPGGTALQLLLPILNLTSENENIDAVTADLIQLKADVPFLGEPAEVIMAGAHRHKLTNSLRTVDGSVARNVDGLNDFTNSLMTSYPAFLIYNVNDSQHTVVSTADVEERYGAGFTVMCRHPAGYEGCFMLNNGTREITSSSFFSPRRLNIYGCVEFCRIISNSLATISDSECLCLNSSRFEQVKVKVSANRLDSCYSPCPDPSSLAQCPSSNDRGRAFHVAAYPEKAQSCVELWRQGAYEYQLYMLQINFLGDLIYDLNVWCHGAPAYMRSSLHDVQPVNPVLLTPHNITMRAGLFSSNPLSFNGIGVTLYNPQTITLDGQYVVRAVRLLGRGDFDFMWKESSEYSNGFVHMFSLLYEDIGGHMLPVVDPYYPNSAAPLRGNRENEEDLSIANFMPFLTSKLQVQLYENYFTGTPVIRMDVVAEPLQTVADKISFRNSMQGINGLGCYLYAEPLVHTQRHLVDVDGKDRCVEKCRELKFPYASVLSRFKTMWPSDSIHKPLHSELKYRLPGGLTSMTVYVSFLFLGKPNGDPKLISLSNGHLDLAYVQLGQTQTNLLKTMHGITEMLDLTAPMEAIHWHTLTLIINTASEKMTLILFDAINSNTLHYSEAVSVRGLQLEENVTMTLLSDYNAMLADVTVAHGNYTNMLYSIRVGITDCESTACVSPAGSNSRWSITNSVGSATHYFSQSEQVLLKADSSTDFVEPYYITGYEVMMDMPSSTIVNLQLGHADSSDFKILTLSSASELQVGIHPLKDDSSPLDPYYKAVSAVGILNHLSKIRLLGVPVASYDNMRRSSSKQKAVCQCIAGIPLSQLSDDSCIDGEDGDVHNALIGYFYPYQLYDNFDYYSMIPACPDPPALPADANFHWIANHTDLPGQHLLLACNDSYMSKDIVSITCSTEGQWIGLMESYYIYCPATCRGIYIPGFMNSTVNMHPDNAVEYPEYYAEFQAKIWEVGIRRKLRCPPGKQLSDATTSTWAECNADGVWVIPDSCNNYYIQIDESSFNFKQKTDDITGYIPLFVAVGLLFFIFIGCYVNALTKSRDIVQFPVGTTASVSESEIVIPVPVRPAAVKHKPVTQPVVESAVIEDDKFESIVGPVGFAEPSYRSPARSMTDLQDSVYYLTRMDQSITGQEQTIISPSCYYSTGVLPTREQTLSEQKEDDEGSTGSEGTTILIINDSDDQGKKLLEVSDEQAKVIMNDPQWEIIEEKQFDESGELVDSDVAKTQP